MYVCAYRRIYGSITLLSNLLMKWSKAYALDHLYYKKKYKTLFKINNISMIV